MYENRQSLCLWVGLMQPIECKVGIAVHFGRLLAVPRNVFILSVLAYLTVVS